MGGINIVDMTTAPGWCPPVRVLLNNGQLAVGPLDPTPIVRPPVADIAKNVDTARGLRATMQPGPFNPDPSAGVIAAMAFLYVKFKQFGEWDYQRPPGRNEFVRGYRAFASFHYGLIMAAAGFSLDDAKSAAGHYNSSVGAKDQSGTAGNAIPNETNMTYGFRVYEKGLLP